MTIHTAVMFGYTDTVRLVSGESRFPFAQGLALTNNRRNET